MSDVLHGGLGPFLAEEAKHEFLLANDERMRDGPYRAERVGRYGLNIADQPERRSSPLIDFREAPLANELDLLEQFTTDEETSARTGELTVNQVQNSDVLDADTPDLGKKAQP